MNKYNSSNEMFINTKIWKKEKGRIVTSEEGIEFLLDQIKQKENYTCTYSQLL